MLEIPPGTPPQLSLLLGQLGQALQRDQSSSAQGYLWASLEQLIRFYAGLALDDPGLRARTAGIEGCTEVLRACLARLPADSPLRQVFFGYEGPLHTRWLKLAEPALDLPPLHDWQPGSRPEAVSGYLPVLRAWLEASRRLFAEEQLTLDREVELTLVGQPGPEPEPEPELSEEDVARATAEEALACNRFELAEREFERAGQLAGRGRARSCQGRWAEAEEDLAGVEDARALFYRAANRRQLGRLKEALEDAERGLERTLDPALRAALEMERAGILQQLGEPASGALQCACDLYQELALREKSTRAEVELACALIEKAFATDPTLKDYRARSDRNQAVALCKKIKKREPLLSLDIELLRYVLERREPWGRSEHDLLNLERDLRALRVLLELLPRSPELQTVQERFLQAAEERLARGTVPDTYLAQLFALFTELAAAGGRHDDRRWQTPRWLALAERFESPEGRLRCLVLACASLQNSPEPSDVELLVALLDQLAGEIGRAAPAGLDLVGAAFNSLRGHLTRLGHDETFRARVQSMAERWRALPPTIPARAGVGRQVLSELAGRKPQNVSVD